jgi:cytoskeleton protein RodZ
MNEAVITPQSAPSPGALLAAARESRGLTVIDIARQLKLSPWQIDALESGDYRRLPGTVFVRGFIRNYARLVNLDAALLLANAERELPPAAPGGPEMPPSAEIPFPRERTFNWHKYAIAAIVLVIPVVIFEFYPGDANETTVKSRQVELPAPQVMAEVKPVAETRQAALPAAGVADASVTGQRPDAGAVRQDKSPAKPPVVVVAASAAPKPGEQLVRFRFEQESWVEVRDRNGRIIFSQLNAAGTEQAVSGKPPLSLVVGNASGVRLTHNQQPVNLAPYTKVDVARLTLD